MIAGILWMLLANAAVLQGAGMLLGRFRTEASLDWPLFLFLRIALISGIVLISGLSGILTAWILGVGGGAAVIFWYVSRSGNPLAKLPRIEAGPLTVIIGLLLALRLAGQVALFHPHVPDSLTYHLPKIAEWIQAGGFTREMGPDDRSSFPAGFELLETWWVVFLRHDALIEMAGVEFMLLGFASVRSLGLSLGLAPRTAAFAGLLYVITPTVHLQATACLNDGAVAALLLTAFALIMGRAPAVWALGVVGLGIGVKPTFVYAIPGAAVLAFCLRRTPSHPIASPRAATGVAIGCFLVGSFWYLRNLLWFHNPIHPMGVSGIRGASGSLAQQFGPSLSSLGWNVQCLLDARLLDPHVPYGSMSDCTAGWGPIAVACGLPALLLALRSDHLWRKAGLAFLASGVSVLAWVQLDRWYLRFLLFVPALLVVAAARLTESWKGLLPILLAGLVLQCSGTMFSWEWSERLTRALPAELAPEEPVACFGDSLGGCYRLYGPGYSRRVIYLRPRSADDLADLLLRSGARILYSAPPRQADRLLLQEALRKGSIQPLDPYFFRLPQKSE